MSEDKTLYKMIESLKAWAKDFSSKIDKKIDDIHEACLAMKTEDEPQQPEKIYIDNGLEFYFNAEINLARMEYDGWIFHDQGVTRNPEHEHIFIKCNPYITKETIDHDNLEVGKFYVIGDRDYDLDLDVVALYLGNNKITRINYENNMPCFQKCYCDYFEVKFDV